MNRARRAVTRPDTRAMTFIFPIIRNFEVSWVSWAMLENLPRDMR
jgi:hypothetical protein